MASPTTPTTGEANTSVRQHPAQFAGGTIRSASDGFIYLRISKGLTRNGQRDDHLQRKPAIREYTQSQTLRMQDVEHNARPLKVQVVELNDVSATRITLKSEPGSQVSAKSAPLCA